MVSSRAGQESQADQEALVVKQRSVRSVVLNNTNNICGTTLEPPTAGPGQRIDEQAACERWRGALHTHLPCQMPGARPEQTNQSQTNRVH